MRALFVVVEQTGDGKTSDSHWRPWFEYRVGHQIEGWAGSRISPYYACNVFAEDQAILDAIAADPRTEFVIPIEVQGKKLSWKNKDDDLPANLHGKITSWIAKAGLHKLDPGMRKPGQVAKYIMSQLSGVEDVDPFRFRIHWKESE